MTERTPAAQRAEEARAAKEQAEQEAQVQAAMDAHGSLLEAIAFVAAKTGTIEKKGFNNHFGYSYVTKDDIVKHLKPLLAEAGLIIIPIHVKTERSEEDSKGYRDLIVSWEMRIIHAPTGATMAVPWESESMDNQDKGFAKATTSAMKQFAQSIFDIPSGDLDTEHDAHSGQTREGGERQSQRPSPSGGSARGATSTKEILDFKETHGLNNLQLSWAVEKAGGDKSAKIKDLDASLRPAILANLKRIVAGSEVEAQEQQAAPDEPASGGSGGGWVDGSDIPFAPSFI
jgi:hypothetical protein